MNDEKDSTDEFGIRKQILEYLVAHPEAEDTLEGVVHWWLQEWQHKHFLPQIKKALESLVKSGVVERREIGQSTLYRLNPKHRKHSH